MASAGRILIMPKGNYDASVTYEMLDMVFYNKTSWLAKKTTRGIEPSDANIEHWHKVCEIELTEYLKLSGGTLKADLGLGDGTGVVGANGYGTYIQSKKDDSNYRGIKIDSTSYANDESRSLKLVNYVNGVFNEYNILGEHNLDLLNQYIDSRISEYMKNNG